MDAITAIKERRSIRKYQDKVVKRELMEEIVSISRFAPSWKNFQIARYTLIDDPAVIEQITNNGVSGFVYNMDTLKNAKGLAVLSYVTGKSGKISKDDSNKLASSWESFDAGIACQTFCLAAHTKGVGTCIMGVIDEENIAEIINLPKNQKVAALIVYGYASSNANKPPRKDVEEILSFI